MLASVFNTKVEVERLKGIFYVALHCALVYKCICCLRDHIHRCDECFRGYTIVSLSLSALDTKLGEIEQCTKRIHKPCFCGLMFFARGPFSLRSLKMCSFTAERDKVNNGSLSLKRICIRQSLLTVHEGEMGCSLPLFLFLLFFSCLVPEL